jgi:hypothetical protein
MGRPTVAVSGHYRSQEKRARDESVRVTSLPRIPTGWWLRELILSQLANADSDTTLPSDGWDLGTSLQRQAKQTRSYLQVSTLIYHKVEVSHLSQPYHPAAAAASLPLTFA